ncbi:MAG: glycosyltransferase family 2 protein [Clostridia bacterium]|nr:glycosyltransferase family 2 protein [Clostridia bacterium]
MKEILHIVIPCYNEEAVFAQTAQTLTDVLKDLIRKQKIAEESRLLFVDDGSRDATWQMIVQAHKDNPYVCGVKLAGNVGHQNALFAGLMAAKTHCDISISIDADLQDDVTAIEKMVDRYHEGCEIVYGVRNDRKSDTFFKRFTAQGFYKLMKRLGVKTVYNHADFRLMSARALEALKQYGERNLYLRGVVASMGFKTDCVYYVRGERKAGESKYPVKKMLSFAFDGITSFSAKPIQRITALGVLITVLALCAALYSLVMYFIGRTIPGWTSLILSIWFLGGMQLAAIGLIGQYIGKIYVETKQRPRYHIEEVCMDVSPN